MGALLFWPNFVTACERNANLDTMVFNWSNGALCQFGCQGFPICCFYYDYYSHTYCTKRNVVVCIASRMWHKWLTLNWKWLNASVYYFRSQVLRGWRSVNPLVLKLVHCLVFHEVCGYLSPLNCSCTFFLAQDLQLKGDVMWIENVVWFLRQHI